MRRLAALLLLMGANVTCGAGSHVPAAAIVSIRQGALGSWVTFIEVAECAAEAHAKAFAAEHRLEFMSLCHPLGSVVARWLNDCAAAESRGEQVVGCLAARWALRTRH